MSDAMPMVIACALGQGCNVAIVPQVFDADEFIRLVERQKAAFVDRVIVKDFAAPICNGDRT